ncbi:hypothetical protein HOI83_01845 [Candidatus Uhrbacteria bacterium]|jgi:hypothetical protein|nr:hypothetical protein [Candidatus Uhrbacteria bacterium]
MAVQTRTKTAVSTKVIVGVAAAGIIIAAAAAGAFDGKGFSERARNFGPAAGYGQGYTPGYAPGYTPGYTPGYQPSTPAGYTPGYGTPGYGVTLVPATPEQIRAQIMRLKEVWNRAPRIRKQKDYKEYQYK